MKKLLLSFGACSLAFAAPLTIPTAASAESGKDVVALCKQLLVDYPGYYKNLGDCVNTPADFCNELKELGILELYFKNHGECVNWVKSTV